MFFLFTTLALFFSQDPYEYPVFHAGPRECLGKRLAMVEMKTVLAELLRHASFRLAVPRDQVLPDTAATLGMSSGLKCRWEWRWMEMDGGDGRFLLWTFFYFLIFFCFGGIVKLMEGLVKLIVKPRICWIHHDWGIYRERFSFFMVPLNNFY